MFQSKSSLLLVALGGMLVGAVLSVSIADAVLSGMGRAAGFLGHWAFVITCTLAIAVILTGARLRFSGRVWQTYMLAIAVFIGFAVAAQSGLWSRVAAHFLQRLCLDGSDGRHKDATVPGPCVSAATRYRELGHSSLADSLLERACLLRERPPLGFSVTYSCELLVRRGPTPSRCAIMRGVCTGPSGASPQFCQEFLSACARDSDRR